MTVFEPFEDAPCLAVGVSGGRDSLALCLLAHDWAQARGGRVVGLTVDHGLRTGSDDEARRVGQWLAAREIEHHTLVWAGDKPTNGRQAAARLARYDLLRTWCRKNGLLHLLLAHHAQDQAETVLLRKESGSGAAGLAGMSAIVETDDFRILRPLLNVSRAHLTATLDAAGQAWIDDPSNADVRYARPRLRQNLSEAQLSTQAQKVGVGGAARMAQETAVSAFIARHVAVHCAGYAVIDLPLDLENPAVRPALSRLLSCLGGAGYPPGPASVDRVIAEIGRADFAGRTLGGCRVVPWTGNAGAAILICRENRNLEPPVTLSADQPIVWDGRFAASSFNGGGGALTLGALGDDGWAQAKQQFPALQDLDLPQPVRAALPALRHGPTLVAVCTGGAAGFGQTGTGEQGQNGLRLPNVRFRPRISLSGGGFSLAQTLARTISNLGSQTARV